MISPITMVLLVVVLFLGPALPALWAQALPVNPVPLDVSPQWVPVPNLGEVHYAPNLSTDLFRYGGQYYCYGNGAWLRGKRVTGPWAQVTTLPPVFYRIDAAYFKTPPGWARGKKTGWGGAPLPPGQMKKWDGSHIPPGQMKKP